MADEEGRVNFYGLAKTEPNRQLLVRVGAQGGYEQGC